MIEDYEYDYVMILRGDCGEELEIWDPTITQISMFCDKCNRIHPFFIRN